MKPSNPPRDNHIIPRFYLQGFARSSPEMRNPAIWVYEKGKSIRASTPEHEAREKDYYVFEKNGQVDYRFEYFLREVEGLAARIFRQLEDPDYFFNFDEKTTIAYFAALMFSRVRPAREYFDQIFGKTMIRFARDHAREREKFVADCKDFQARSGKGFDIESLRKFILSGNYEIEQMSTGYNLRVVLETTVKIAPFLLAKNWSLLRSDGDYSFVTSDNPVCNILPDSNGMALVGVGFGLEGAEIIFPLRADVCLVMTSNRGEGIGSPEPRYIKSCNRAVMMLAQRHLYAPRQSQNLDREFQSIGCKSIYGKTALVPPTSRTI